MQDRKVTSFQQPPQPQEESAYVHPAVKLSPEAAAYEMGMRARQAKRVSKYQDARPVDPVSFPPLEQQHREGMTMSEQAAMHGPTATSRVSALAAENSIVEGQVAPFAPVHQSAPAQPRFNIKNTDLLPQEAQKDPAYMQGSGANYAVNQPMLAAKYGVIRDGVHVPAQMVQGSTGRTAARPIQELVQDLAAINTAQKVSEPKIEDTDSDEKVELSAEEKEEAKEALKKLDDFDYDSLRRQIAHDSLNNPEQKRIVESRLAPLDIGDLIMHDRVVQRVPIIPGKFEITFQSMTGDEDLALKRLLMVESKSVEVTDAYLLDKFRMMSLAVGCMKINNNPCPSCMDEEGNFSDKKFWIKFAWMLRRGLHVLASISVHHNWFELRVRQLLVAEKIKNG